MFASKFCKKLMKPVQHFDASTVHMVGKTLSKIGIPHTFPLCLLLLYSTVGGVLFMYLEQEQYSPGLNSNYVASLAAYETRNAEFYRLINTELSQQLVERFSPAVIRKNITFEAVAFLLDCFQRLNATPVQPPQVDRIPWNFVVAVFYSVTLYTTIGYGSYVPHSVESRCATMLYALLGIPLMLTVLNFYGKLMFHLLKFIWTWFVRRFCKIIPKFCRIKANQPDIPLRVCVCILIGWTCGSALLIFRIQNQNWTYFMCVYFFFMSITTIGLGDVVPEPENALYCFPLIFAGLVLVSMCINTLQCKIESSFHTMVRQIDQEYQRRQMDDADALERKNTDASLGVWQLSHEQTWNTRVLCRFMNDYRRRELEELWLNRANRANHATQTIVRTASVGMQTDDDEVSRKFVETASESDIIFRRRSNLRNANYGATYLYNCLED